MTQENAIPLEEKIIRQVEYYFGDSNLARDNFLKDQLGKEDGWVEIKTLLTFNRLKALTEDQQTVADALRKSTTGLLEVNEAGDKIKRITPLPEFTDEYKNELKLRTVHLRGFPTSSTLDEITQFCSQYGKVEQVQMRRLQDKKTFKGCIFVVFKTIEEAQKAVNGQEKFLDQHELQREDKKQYFERKSSRNIKKNKRLVNLENKNGDEETKEEDFKFEPGCVLKLKGVNESTGYFDIKQAFMEHVKVEYVELLKEKSEAIVRFSSSTDLKVATDKLKSAETTEENKTEEQNQTEAASEESVKPVQITIGEQKLDTEVMTGDEETEYWKNVIKIRSEFTKKSKANFKNKRGKRKQGFGGNQKKKLRAEE